MSIFQASIPALFNQPSTVISTFPLEKPPRVSFDLSGVSGLVGGDDAVSAMATVHVYGNRRWLGWYNTPGSFQIAKRLRSFAKSASPRRVFSSSKSFSTTVDTDPKTLLGLDSCKGPKFRAAHSGTVIHETGHVAALLMKECAAWDLEGRVIPGRTSQPVGITIVDLGQAPAPEVRLVHGNPSTLLFASVPVATSIGTCVLCALCGDWYASSLILMGIVASGVFCLVLGSADFVFTHPEPANGSPAGDGILGSGKDIVLLRGSEGAVNSITRGSFSLRFSSEAHFKLVQRCSLLFLVQSIVQLLLTPQVSFFGQIMFLASLGVSALYNAWLSSQDKEKIHQKLLLEEVLDSPTMAKYTLGTHTAAVVFTLLVLQSQNPAGLLNELLPNDTKVWRRFKTTILEQLHRPDDKSLFDEKTGDLDNFTQQELDLLEQLYDDARVAYDGYRGYLRCDLL